MADGTRTEAAARAEAARAAFRAVARYVLRGVASRADAAGGDATDAFIMAAMLDANVGHLDKPSRPARFAGFDSAAPDAVRTPVSGVALAERLGLPRETVRRRLAELERDGRCVRHAAGGFYVPATRLTGDGRRPRAQAHYAAVRRLWRDLKADTPNLSWPPPPAGIAPVDEPVRLVNRRAVAFALDFLRPIAGLAGGYEQALVYLAVVEATWRPRRDDEAAVPSLLIAQSIERPAESVRRRMAGLIKRGLVRRRATGFAAQWDPRHDATFEALLQDNLTALQALIDEMTACGAQLG